MEIIILTLQLKVKVLTPKVQKVIRPHLLTLDLGAQNHFWIKLLAGPFSKWTLFM
jgi:hypothetical protein